MVIHNFCREEGIRTLDTLLAYTHFPGVRLRPLGHLSIIWSEITKNIVAFEIILKKKLIYFNLSKTAWAFLVVTLAMVDSGN